MGLGCRREEITRGTLRVGAGLRPGLAPTGGAAGHAELGDPLMGRPRRVGQAMSVDVILASYALGRGAPAW